MERLAPSTFLPYARQCISPSEIEEVVRVLGSDFITRGPKTEEFESKIAEYCGAKYAVAFTSGSAALLAACHAAELSSQDRVLTTPNSFVATTSAILNAGANPIFIDVSPETGNIDLDELKPNLRGQQTRGRPIILPIHYAGIPLDMQALDAMIAHPDAVIIEDGAAALGSQYDADNRVGSCMWSHMTILSFHPAKLLTCGEGGMVTTNDEELCRRLRRFRNNGLERDAKYFQNKSEGPWYYEVQEATCNYHMTELQAALGLTQLARIDEFIAKRRQIVSWYRSQLSDLEQVDLLPQRYDGLWAPQLMAALINYTECGTTRAAVMEKLKLEGIGTQVHYMPIYRQPFFAKKAGDLRQYLPGMEAFYSRALTLPLYQDLLQSDVERVCESLRRTLGEKP